MSPKEGGKGDTSKQPLDNGPSLMLSFRLGVPGHSSAQAHAQYHQLVSSVVQLQAKALAPAVLEQLERAGGCG